MEYWSLTTSREKPIKIGTQVVRHGRYFTFQLAEVAIQRSLFPNILWLMEGASYQSLDKMRHAVNTIQWKLV